MFLPHTGIHHPRRGTWFSGGNNVRPYVPVRVRALRVCRHYICSDKAVWTYRTRSGEFLLHQPTSWNNGRIDTGFTLYFTGYSWLGWRYAKHCRKQYNSTPLRSIATTSPDNGFHVTTVTANVFFHSRSCVHIVTGGNMLWCYTLQENLEPIHW